MPYIIGMVRFATCHPNRQNFGKGLCQACYKQKWYLNHKESHFASHLRSKYALDVATYRYMYATQKGKCAICDIARPLGGYDGLVVDHDHTTKIVRGLLCKRCNHLLDAVDSLGWLDAARVYVLGGDSHRQAA